MKLPQPWLPTEQTSPRAAQPWHLMAPFFRERMGPRRLGAPRRALESGSEPYHIKLRCYERNYTPTSPSAASTATDATSPSAGPSAIMSPKKTSHFANPFVSDDARAFTRFTSTRPDTA